MAKAQPWDYAAVDELMEKHDLLELSVNQYEAVALAVHRIGPGLFPQTPLYRALVAEDLVAAHDALLDLARYAGGDVKADYQRAAALFISEIHQPPHQPDDPGVEPAPEPQPRETDPLSILLFLGGLGALGFVALKVLGIL